ncbi:MAG: hypothetical protein U0324_02340 [Polyangiales bacterium]
MEPTNLDPNDLEPTDEHSVPNPRTPWVVASLAVAALALSLAFNVGLWRGLNEARSRPAPPTPTCPPPPTCPTCPTPAPVAAPECPVCPDCAAPPPTTGTASATPPRPRPPREDADAAAEGEAHVAAATAHGEHDPVNLAAQRRVVTAVDRIVDSHSPAAAERFIQRNLPGIASMDCAFRDPALAEHVRMRLRELNQTARAANRLSEADLARYERDLRCPRE